MKRTDAIKHHTDEAAACDRLAGAAPNTPGGRQQTALANDHRALAEAAAAGDYETDLED